MDANSRFVINKMKTPIMKTQNQDFVMQVDAFTDQIKLKSDKLMNYFLITFFIGGVVLAFFYDTWLVATGVGGLSLIAYYSAKWTLPKSNLYQYVASAVLGIFMAQYIYQMHGLFEMHFVAFIGSAMLITYQNWKLQIPITLLVVIHHAVFGYLQFIGFDKIYFTQLDYMSLSTFIIHASLAAIIFFISGLWAYQFKKYGERHIEQAYEVARLSEAELQKDALIKANSELDKFVYSVSHDLRAPLSSMKGVIEISEEETRDPLMLEHFGLLKGSIKKLDEFIQDILEYSRNSRMEIKKQEINFKEMLDEITNDLKHMSSNNERQVSINYEINNQQPFISDKGRVSILLNNLISNAIRYQNPETDKPCVDVEINMTDTKTGIVVKDNGIGISNENQQKIFDMFYRVSENSIGSGLGLYLVKEIVDKLEGKIEIESELGKGTAFSVEIPNNTLNN
jgi:signal transduction histidine kinase